MVKADDALQAKLSKLTPAQREALLKKLKQKKSEKPNKNKDLAFEPIQRVNRESNRFPLSFAQQRLWFMEQFDKGSAAYNIAVAIELEGKLNIPALEQTFNKIIQRHESLRTVFLQDHQGAYQQVLPELAWRLEILDISNDEESLQAAIRQEADTGFCLETGPLFRSKLIEINDSKHVLTIVMHHIISDAWSAHLLFAEVSRTYTSLVQNTALAMPPAKIQYLDYAQWQRQLLESDTLNHQTEYWKAQLAQCNNLNLPTDKPRPKILTQNGSHHRISLGKPSVSALRKVANNKGTTLFNALFTVFECLLYRYTQQQDFCIGTPVANRNHPDSAGLIGFFVNSLAIRANITEQDSFLSLLEKVSSNNLEAQSNQDIPFESLVDQLQAERDGSHSPIFQAFFSYNPGLSGSSLQLPGIQARFIPADTSTSKFELSLIISDSDDGLSCHFEYNTDLFEADTITQLAEHFKALAHAAGQHPELRINELPLLSANEFEQQISQTNHQDFAFASIAEQLKAQAALTPAAIAVKQGGKTLSFAELDQRSNQLAQQLIQAGVQQGDRIGVCLPPCIELSIALAASIKLGATYVPMDPSYPTERLSYIIDNAGIEVLLTVSRIATQALNVKNSINIDLLDFNKIEKAEINTVIKPEDPLYIIYTSGSTGKPKAAVVSHANENNLLQWYSHTYQLTNQDKILVFSAIGFDLTQKNLLAPLCFGAELHFSSTEYFDPQSIIETIDAEKISWVNCAPSAFYPLADQAHKHTKLSSLRHVFFGGENIDLGNLKPWIDSDCFNADIINMYGPTECTDIATSHTVNTQQAISQPIPIGKASANVNLYVLDNHHKLLPSGAIGELYIGGESVGLGYFENETLTAERFIDNPFRPGEKMYRTGDLVRWNKEQQLVFVARVDDQIKIRGFRIELGEIETQLKHIAGIDEAVVAAKNVNGQKQLIAYLCTKQALQTTAYYKKTLGNHLPDFMIPIAYSVIDEIPLSPNGKVDRAALPDIDISILRQAEFVAPRNTVEQQLAEIWEALLQVESIGVNDNFFELGGHSLLATQLLLRIQETFSIDLPLRTLFEVNTLEGIAEMIQAMMPNSHDDDDEDFEEGVL